MRWRSETTCSGQSRTIATDELANQSSSADAPTEGESGAILGIPARYFESAQDWSEIVDDGHRIAGSAPRILFVSSEVFPLAKTGGLADVCGALPATLSTLGADVRVMLPGYPPALDRAGRLNVVSGCELPDGRLLMGRLPDSDVP